MYKVGSDNIRLIKIFSFARRRYYDFDEKCTIFASYGNGRRPLLRVSKNRPSFAAGRRDQARSDTVPCLPQPFSIRKSK